MRKTAVGILILLGLFYQPAKAEEGKTLDLMIEHPERYIKVINWSFYTAFRTAIIHHVTIENT